MDAKHSKHKAAIPNPALKAFNAFVGEWKAVGAHALIPDTVLHGHASFTWLEGGAFLMMRSEMEEEGIPSGTAIFGSDNAAGEYFMLYFDERTVSRKMDVKMQDNVLTWWRNGPDFSQRYTYTFTDDGNTIICKGELSKDGTAWEKDLNLTYTRVE